METSRVVLRLLLDEQAVAAAVKVGGDIFMTSFSLVMCGLLLLAALHVGWQPMGCSWGH